jgi:hypothetical protein
MSRILKRGISIIKGLKKPLTEGERIKAIEQAEMKITLEKDYLKKLEKDIKSLPKDDKEMMDALKEVKEESKVVIEELNNEIINLKIDAQPLIKSMKKKGGRPPTRPLSVIMEEARNSPLISDTPIRNLTNNEYIKLLKTNNGKKNSIKKTKERTRGGNIKTKKVKRKKNKRKTRKH